MEYKVETNPEFADKLDQADPLKKYRERFIIPEPEVIYLDGNSLGRLTIAAKEKLNHIVDYEWGTRLIRSWNEGWYDKSADAARLISRIIGARHDEVLVADSTSVNLFKLSSAALKLQEGRKKIISDEMNFPTDLYILQGLIAQDRPDYRLKLIRSEDGISPDLEELKREIDEDTALVVLSMVAFKSGYLYDIKEITRLAHQKGALVLWDLSHAAGAVPVDLQESGADFAIGCTYKYLNGGPGSPAYMYVRKDLIPDAVSPLWGWFGDRDPFSFNLDYNAPDSIRKFLVGTPPILSLAIIEPALNVTLCAGIEKIREKSIRQSEYLIYLIGEFLEPLGFFLGSPQNPERRGSHISLRHPEGFRICKALINAEGIEYKVIPDFREPDNIRLGIAPLYNSYKEIYNAVQAIRTIVKNGIYKKQSGSRESVT